MPVAELLPIWQRPVALAPLNDMYILKPSFNLPLSVYYVTYFVEVQNVG
jgi:hypothetical protein